MKKVIVACGGAVATSTIAANKVTELCHAHGIDVQICQCRISEIESNLEGASLIVPTGRLKRDFGVPVVAGTPFISGVGVEKVEAAILDALK